MASYNKFNVFGKNIHEGQHNLSTAVLKIALTNTAPAASNSVLADIAQIGATGGYNSGGFNLPVISSSQTSGTYKLVVSDVTFTAIGSCGPLRYAVIYDSSSDQNKLIGWYDLGTSVTLQAGESIFLDFTGDNSLFTHV